MGVHSTDQDLSMTSSTDKADCYTWHHSLITLSMTSLTDKAGSDGPSGSLNGPPPPLLLPPPPPAGLALAALDAGLAAGFLTAAWNQTRNDSTRLTVKPTEMIVQHSAWSQSNQYRWLRNTHLGQESRKSNQTSSSRLSKLWVQVQMCPLWPLCDN